MDSLVRIHRGDENSARDMALVFEAIKIFTKANVSVLLTHHNRKQGEYRSMDTAQDIRGSSDILAAIDSLVQLTTRRDDPNTLILTQTKSRQGSAVPRFEVLIRKGESGAPQGFEFKEFENVKPKKAKPEATSDAILSLLANREPWRRRDILRALNDTAGKNTVDEAMRACIEAGKVELIAKSELPFEANRREKYYRLRLANSDKASADSVSSS